MRLQSSSCGGGLKVNQSVKMPLSMAVACSYSSAPAWMHSSESFMLQECFVATHL